MTNTSGASLAVIVAVTLSNPATVTGNESLAVGTGGSINADDVFINALYVDIDEPINVGQSSNWSVSLPSSLNSNIAEDQSNYAAGIYSTVAGDPQGYYTLPVSTVSPGDTLITAQYDAITQQIIVNDASTPPGDSSSSTVRS